jgi:hypothetical protein
MTQYVAVTDKAVMLHDSFDMSFAVSMHAH